LSEVPEVNQQPPAGALKEMQLSDDVIDCLPDAPTVAQQHDVEDGYRKFTELKLNPAGSGDFGQAKG
jgi:hypothetical protein